MFTEFQRSANANPERMALITPRGRVSYAELAAVVRAFASHLLRARQAGPIAIRTGDAPLFLKAFFACAAIGRPALILDPARPLSHALDLLKRHAPDCPVIEDDAVFSPTADQAAGSEWPRISDKDEFYWGLTSGTTGEPKLFARSHKSWLASFEAAEAIFVFPPGSRILITGPLCHSLFLYGAVHALCRGHTVVTLGAFRPDRAAAAASQASHIYAVPAMLAEMLGAGFKDKRPVTVFSGGAKLSLELRAHCESGLPNAEFVEFYGASETSFIAAHSSGDAAPSASIGKLFPGVHIRIRSAIGASLPPGEEGEIFVNSPMLFSRYVGKAPAPEWVSVGDMGYLDERGFLYLTGRTGRMINSRGLKIRPEALERCLLTLPGIKRAAVIGLPNDKRGAVAVAAVEFEPGATLTRRALSRHCRTQLGTPFSPKRFFATAAMPFTPSGKIALDRLRNSLLLRDPAFHELT